MTGTFVSGFEMARLKASRGGFRKQSGPGTMVPARSAPETTKNYRFGMEQNRAGIRTIGPVRRPG
jgi:hypothetical protein